LGEGEGGHGAFRSDECCCELSTDLRGMHFADFGQ